jgi:hypothetical protein
MRQRKHIPPALLNQLRYEYEETNTPIADLATRADMSKWTFHRCVRDLKWSMRVPGRGGFRHSTPLSTFAGKRAAAEAEKPGVTPNSAAPALPSANPLDRSALAARIQRSIERELDAIERVLDLLQPQNGNEAERAARTLAALARTLREVATLDTDTSAEADPDDDAGPRDMEEFRRELTRRMESIIAERTDPATPQPQS